jgi:hypothetical protein
LRKNLSTFPIIINNGAPDGNIVKGQPTQFCIDVNGNRIFRCASVNADTGYCHWVEVYVNTSRTIAGLSLKDDVKNTDLHNALLVYPTIMNYVEGAEGKRG